MGSGASTESSPTLSPPDSLDRPKPGWPNGQPMSRPVSSFNRTNSTVTNGGPPPQYSKRQSPAPPRPPQHLKEEIFREEDYRHVDEYVSKIPPKLYKGTFRELVTYLTSDPSWDDLAKVRAMFRFVTSVDVFSLKVEDTPPKHSPMDYFIKIKENTGNHAHLLNGLCQMANIPCEILSGMNKSAAYEIGKSVERKAMGAQWNAVYVAGDWRFVDAFWASACVVGKKSGEWALVDADEDLDDGDEEVTEGTTQHRINEFYFLPDPDQFIWTHFPDKPEWQLMSSPVPVNVYQDHFYVRERFHILRMRETPQTKIPCLLTTSEGEVALEFGLPADNSAQLRFKYMLYRSRSKTDGNSLDTYLDRFVLFEHREDLLRFTLRFPVRGAFKLDIYGLDLQVSDIFDLCCSYVIECPQPKANCLPLPDCPPLGWGPVSKTKEAGLKPVTHQKAHVAAKDGYVEIRLDKDKALSLHQQLKHAVLDDATLSKYCLTRVEKDEVVVYLRLPQEGEYALKLFAQEPGAEGDADNVLNYLVQCQGRTDMSKPFPNTSHGTLGKGPDADRCGVKAKSHPGGTHRTADGKMSVEFEANEGVELVCEVHTVDGKALSHVTATRRHENGKWVFDLDLPVEGEYSLNVFAKEKGNEAEIFSVHTYLVQSEGHPYEEKTEDGSEESEGEGQHHIHMETVETSDKEVFIPVPPGCEDAVVEFHRRNGQKREGGEQVEVVGLEDFRMFRLALDDYAEYVLNVYTEAGPPGSGQLRNVAKYQVNRRRPGELYSGNINAIMDTIEGEKSDEKPPTPNAGSDGRSTTIDDSEAEAAKREKERRQLARKAVQQAMELKDQKQLEAAIARYKDTGVASDDAVLLRAQKLLTALQAKAELMEATQKRDLAALEKALSHAKEVNFEHQLDLQIALAARLKEHLVRLEKLRHAVLNMDQKAVAELKSYGNPPAGVHESMMATFLLLGSPMKEVKVWRTCQVLMSKTGRESMMRKISHFDPRSVPMKVTEQAKKVMSAFTTDQIRDASSGAATFYIWAQGMIEEVESYGGAEQADHMRLQK